MTWRTVVISKRSKLFFKMGHMVIRDFENKITKIYLKDISHVILTTTEISITVALMNEFQKQKIKLIISDEKGNPSAELTPLYNSFNSTEKIKAQIK
ncbi:CRISPR-associated endonuclease Cas1 [Anaerococcus hydrogenalis]|uniref:CRISPR-associated endonuclease Cas1 n=1 Tax=Anaerococcus hydrogenalis TaxID=33029 RepID=UPI0023F02CCA|nr:CRISPR-associated endonuclease Cas1 [Anaerococcus hydrogenalis]